MLAIIFDKNLTMAKFTVEVIYTLPSNFNIDINTVEQTRLDLGLDIGSNFQLKITNVDLRLDGKQVRLFVDLENEGVRPEPPEVIQESIGDLKKRLLEILKDLSEHFALLLQLRYRLPPLILTDVKISTIQIDNCENKDIISKDIANVIESISLTIKVQLEPNDLRDLVKKAADLVKLDGKSKDMLKLLKRIIKWYFHALNESEETDKFIHYFTILEIWKLYKAYKDNDEECIPTQKRGIPHKKCLYKAIKGLCEDVLSKWNVDFDVFYKDGRNKVIHEGLQEVASKYLGIASECAEKIIEELQKEIQNFLQHK